MNGRDPSEAIGGGITVANDPELFEEISDEEVQLLIEDDLLDLSLLPADTRVRPVAVAQGLMYIATGLWPFVHLRSFEAVTGLERRKRERWLVKTVGLLLAAIGATLLAGARDRRAERTTRVLGATSAAAVAIGWLLRARSPLRGR